MASKFGGVAVDETPATGSKFGGAPVNETAEFYPTFSKIPGFDYVRPVANLAAGAGSGVAQTAAGLYDLLRRIPGAATILPDSTEFHRAIQHATPDNTPAHVGKFLEGMTEFMIPASRMAEATKGMGLATRMAGQAAVGGGVAAAQTGGDPAAIATGAILGGGGEVAGDVARGAMGALGRKAPTLANFAESFGGATPTQKARISRALDVLTKDGIVPPDSVHETQDVIKGKLDELTQAYQNLDPAIKARGADPADVVDHLRDLQKQYMRRGVVTDPPAYNAIEREIKKVQDIAAAPVPGATTPGKVNVDDIVHLKQQANGRTNWNSPDAEKSLWRGIGDAYRSAADTLAPEITPLNRDYSKYTDLGQIIDQNIARGKGVSPSGLTVLLKHAKQSAAGAAAGGALGGAVAGPVGVAGGSLVGGLIGPKLGKAAAQAIQNAVDSGAFGRLAPVRQGLLRSMAAMGDNAGVLKLLGTSVTEETAAGR